jgi:hypothetical protein
MLSAEPVSTELVIAQQQLVVAQDALLNYQDPLSNVRMRAKKIVDQEARIKAIESRIATLREAQSRSVVHTPAVEAMLGSLGATKLGPPFISVEARKETLASVLPRSGPESQETPMELDNIGVGHNNDLGDNDRDNMYLSDLSALWWR